MAGELFDHQPPVSGDPGLHLPGLVGQQAVPDLGDLIGARWPQVGEELDRLLDVVRALRDLDQQRGLRSVRRKPGHSGTAAGMLLTGGLSAQPWSRRAAAFGCAATGATAVRRRVPVRVRPPGVTPRWKALELPARRASDYML
jgi:hypothetical protein